MFNSIIGPLGKATVVLLRTQFESDLPNKKDVKNLLKVNDLAYYRSHGKFAIEIFELERALNIVNGHRCKAFRSDMTNYTSSDILVMTANVNPQVFFTLKYTGVVIAGFNLDVPAMNTLRESLKLYDFAIRMESDAKQWLFDVTNNMQKMHELGLSDPVVTDINLQLFSDLKNTYGQAAIADATSRLKAWHSQYAW